MEKERAAAASSASAAASAPATVDSTAPASSAAEVRELSPLLEACQKGNTVLVRRLLGLPRLPQVVEEAKFNFDASTEGKEAGAHDGNPSAIGVPAPVHA
jgi:hypothetical protein